ncbi:hypothetical protein [Serratia symbiotica]|uniref:Uncharacterized protein n=1 Tax=Serratia symbiotica TaxID=138074 RepID=A0A455VRA7_9GAMM|nr:hypothetical protein [Serratia symbiotica]BBI92465.1 hypothetical protein SSYIS1_22080 [Serratia symbiotica]
MDEERLRKQARIARKPPHRKVRGFFIGKRKVKQEAENEKQSKILQLLQ